jgi:branched-chain amino acid transport system substrate-binding protein
VRAQITRLQSKLSDVDYIYVSSYTPPGAEVLRQIRDAGIKTPILSTVVSIYGPTATQITGPMHDYVTNGYACVVDCSGENNPAMGRFMKAWLKAYKKPPATGSQPAIGYDTASVIAEGIRRAGTADGDALRKAIDTMPKLKLASGTIKFSSTCHQPLHRDASFFKYDGMKAKFLGRLAASKIPDVGDHLACAGQK